MDSFEYIHEEDLSEEKLSDDIYAICAINATIKTKGVIGLSGGLTDSFSENILGKENLKKGVKVDQGDDGIALEVFVVLKYGSNIPAVAWDIQENVKKEIEIMTDKNVKSVNIHVQGIKLAKEEK
ncbi:MAG: Asp23/Gls24 family envelope stress response protein [Anaerovoracaceae bacterium]